MLLAVALVAGWVGASAAISGYQALNGKTGFSFTDLVLGKWPGGSAPSPPAAQTPPGLTGPQVPIPRIHL